MATQNYVRKKTAVSLTDRKRARLLKNLTIAKLPPKDHSDKGADEEIKTIKQQMEFILGVTKTGLDIIDSEFNIRYINTEWANKVYGNPTGKKCFEYFKNRSEVCPNCGIPQALKTKTIVVTEGELAKEGNRPIQVTTIPFKNSNGEWLVAEVNVDISERKRIEEGLRKVQDELEIRIQGRTVELVRANEAMLVEIIERKRTEEALKKSEETAKQMAQENAVMAEIGRIINSTLNIEEVYERFAEKVREIIPFDRISITTINLEDHTTKIAYVFGVEVPDRNPGDVIPLTALFEKILAKQSSILIQTDDENEFAERYPVLLNTFRAGIRSMTLTPLISKDKVIGILHLRSKKSNAYSERDLRLAERVGHQIAGAIANAQLFMERKQVEEKYRTIVRTTMDGFWIVDMQGRFLEVNDAYCQLIGYSRDELLTMSIPDVEAGESHEETARRIQKIMEVGEDRFETRHKCKDGRIIDIEVSVNYREIGGGRMFVFLRDITERKRSEEKLRESEERYRTAIEHSNDGVAIDQGGQLLFVNQKFAEMFDYDKPDEITGKWVSHIVHPDDLKRVEEIIFKRQKGEIVPSRYEFKGIRKNGEPIDLEVSATKTVYRGESVSLVYLRDITERKRTEEALRKSEAIAKRLAQENAIKAEIGRIISSSLNIDEVYERFSEEVRQLIPFDRIAINLINPKDNMITFAHATGVDVAGRRAGDIIPLVGSAAGECIRTRSSLLIQPDDVDKVRSQFPLLSPTFQAEPHSRMFVPLISKDQVIGSLFLRSTKHNPYTDQDLKLAESIGDQIAGAVANALLFTEHIKAEEALRQSEEKYRTILENIEDGYYEVDLAGNFTFFNDSMCRIWGYPIEELMGMNDRQYTDQENAKKLFQSFNKVYRTGEPTKRTDWEIIRKDGTKRYIEASVSLQKDSSGEPIGFRGIIRDITERKHAEKEMTELQEQLRQSQKMEAIGRLAGGIAHDFNNLLTIIKGYSQLSLFDLKENDPLRENIQEIQSATQRATDLTRQLLAFSRRQILNPKVLDLNYLLKDLDKMLRRIIGEDIELNTLFADDLGRVKIDPGEFEQIILNLAVNAKEAMPSGGKLTIETTNVELDEEYANTHIGVIPGRCVMLSITDTGVGMPKEVLEKVFEPFFTTKEKGTGLGLSTVYGIVNQSGGTIWVDTEPGHGTTFKIYLPRVEEELDILQMRVETDTLPRGSETVLLVEDDQSVRSLAYHILHRQGYTILEEANGEKALRLAQEHAGEKIHLLFTDVVMPHMNGKELADQLKLLRPDIKVLYTSGYTDNAIVHHGVLTPGTHILHKPFSPKSLSQKVRKVLDA